MEYIRLSGLVLLHVDRDVIISHRNVIDKFAKQNTAKRLLFSSFTKITFLTMKF